MMDLVTRLRRDEGVRYRPYVDSRGFETVGVGHKILPSEKNRFSQFVALSDGQVNFILNEDIAAKRAQLGALPWYAALDPIRQDAICNMAFNMGVEGVLGFHHMIAALEAQNWQEASDQCAAPHWIAEVHERGNRIAEQLLTGEWQ